ncbi:MAG: type I 3-dehydroquinate dehydratase [Lachnospiraceae bacterium]|nr:type I 3-dehydroquinate dehydratase [Lachnospiraceae bacterium]
MHIVEVKNLKIGEGLPKICVSIIGKTKEEIISAAKELVQTKADIAEWRVDWYEEANQIEKVLEIAQELQKTLKAIPLLFTFRTVKEGGEKSILGKAYEALNLAVIQSGFVDLVDTEVFMDEKIAKSIIHTAHKANVKVVGSNHDFEKTPDEKEILHRLCYMQELGVDLPKIAVMPKTKKDVLTLLSATIEMNEKYAKRPIITMSMSKDGVISRISGEIFGSAVTFGAAKAASAPGQIGVEQLSEILNKIHEDCVK